MNKIQNSSNININIFKENLLNFKKQCKWPWNSSYIDNNGDVSPCCILGDSKVKSFGNINNDNFSNIWNSENYQQFRNDIKNNKIPSFCKSCYSEFK